MTTMSAEDTPNLKHVEDHDLRRPPPPHGEERNNWLEDLNTTIQHNFQLKQVHTNQPLSFFHST